MSAGATPDAWADSQDRRTKAEMPELRKDAKVRKVTKKFSLVY